MGVECEGQQGALVTIVDLQQKHHKDTDTHTHTPETLNRRHCGTVYLVMNPERDKRHNAEVSQGASTLRALYTLKPPKPSGPSWDPDIETYCVRGLGFRVWGLGFIGSKV